MTDNVGVTPGTGVIVAADDVGGVLYQRIKVTYGADGSASDVSTSSPLPVQLSTAQLTTLTPLTTVTANLGTLNGAALAAKQPALGTAGTPAADILTVQGADSMTPVTTKRGAGALTDHSGTITAGGTAQQACPANTSRVFLLIANPDAASTLYVSFTGTASAGAGSLPIAPGQTLVFSDWIPSGAVSVFGATTGKPFTVQDA